MAGVKGRSGGPRPNSGGARPGAGRKPGKTAAAPTDDALKFLLGVMNDPTAPVAQRVRAAVAAVQYQHTKRGDGGKKDAAQAAANAAAGGKFGARKAPLKLVSGG